MHKKHFAQSLMDYGILLFAGLLYAIALKYFVLPSRVVLTGTEGISAALSYYFESDSLFIILYMAFQVVLISFAFVKVSKVFALRSLVVVMMVTVMLTVLPVLEFASPEPQNERIILVIFGGLIAGWAKAMAFRHRGSTGDEDVLAAYFAMKYLKPVGSIAVAAAVVSTTFGLLMDLIKNGSFESVINTLMYTCIYIFISAETLNNFYRKFKLCIVTIITRNTEVVGKAIKSTSEHRTFNVQQGVGGHTGEAYSMVRTIITHEELPAMLQSIVQADPQCFFYHYDIEGISRNYYIPPIK